MTVRLASSYAVVVIKTMSKLLNDGKNVKPNNSLDLVVLGAEFRKFLYI